MGWLSDIGRQFDPSGWFSGGGGGGGGGWQGGTLQELEQYLMSQYHPGGGVGAPTSGFGANFWQNPAYTGASDVGKLGMVNALGAEGFWGKSQALQNAGWSARDTAGQMFPEIGREFDQGLSATGGAHGARIGGLQKDYGMALAGLESGYGRAEQALSGVGAASRQRAYDTGASAAGGMDASMQRRGLYNTTTATNAQRGVASDTARTVADIDEGVAGLRTGLLSRRASDLTGLLTNRAESLGGARGDYANFLFAGNQARSGLQQGWLQTMANMESPSSQGPGTMDWLGLGISALGALPGIGQGIGLLGGLLKGK